MILDMLESTVRSFRTEDIPRQISTKSFSLRHNVILLRLSMVMAVLKQNRFIRSAWVRSFVVGISSRESCSLSAVPCIALIDQSVIMSYYQAGTASIEK